MLADLERIVVPGVTQVQHPRYFGWFPSNATLTSVLGDLAAGGLGALGITWQSAPALTEVEEVVVEWLRELTALPASWKGVIQDTASSGAWSPCSRRASVPPTTRRCAADCKPSPRR